jgi:hypothetical protein
MSVGKHHKVLLSGMYPFPPFLRMKTSWWGNDYLKKICLIHDSCFRTLMQKPVYTGMTAIIGKKRGKKVW